MTDVATGETILRRCHGWGRWAGCLDGAIRCQICQIWLLARMIYSTPLLTACISTWRRCVAPSLDGCPLMRARRRAALLSRVRRREQVSWHNASVLAGQLVQPAFASALSCTRAGLGYAGRYDVIPFGVNTEVFRPRDKADARRQVGLPADATLILWLGRFGIGDKADLLPLIRVFAQLQQSTGDPRLRLVLAGSGPGRDVGFFEKYAQALGIRDRIEVLPETSPAVRHLLHAAADIFVSPADNIQETMGITPLEAMACGVPQVVSNWDGYREIVRHGETGFLVDTFWYPSANDIGQRAPLDSGDGSPQPFLDHIKLAQSVPVDPFALHEALRQLVAEPELRRRFGEASRRRALQHHSWEVVISRYEALWQELRDIRRADTYTPTVQGLAFLSSSYDRIFGHYPSHLLQQSSMIFATADALEVLAGKRVLPLYEDRAGLMVDNLADILSFLAEQDSGTTLGEILRREGERGVPGPLAARHVLWLMKQGLVRQQPSAS